MSSDTMGDLNVYFLDPQEYTLGRGVFDNRIYLTTPIGAIATEKDAQTTVQDISYFLQGKAPILVDIVRVDDGAFPSKYDADALTIYVGKHTNSDLVGPERQIKTRTDIFIEAKKGRIEALLDDNIEAWLDETLTDFNGYHSNKSQIAEKE